MELEVRCGVQIAAGIVAGKEEEAGVKTVVKMGATHKAAAEAGAENVTERQ